MRNYFKAGCVTAFAAASMLGASNANAVVIYGIGSNPISEQRLVSFRSDNVQAGSVIPFDTAVSVTGLQNNERLVGIDFRPINGLLYGVGSSSRLYTIDPVSGMATPISLAPFATRLNGTEFGVDFNPVTDADGDAATPSLRIVSDLEQSLAVNADTGVVTTVSPLITRSGSTPATISVAAAAYENNDTDTSTGTRLLVIDAIENNLNQQNPTTSVLTRLGASVETTNLIGFDILTDSAGINTGFVAHQNDPVFSSTQLSIIDLNTGAASFQGIIGDADGNFLLRGIAVAPVPEPTSLALLGLGALGLAARRRRI